MPSTKLLKERIESIQDTMKITNATQKLPGGFALL